MKKTSFKTLAAFKAFVYAPGEGHFFLLCEIHRNLLQRKQDYSDDQLQGEKSKCDYPKCRLDAGYEFFPNLTTVLKKRYQ